MKKSTIIFLFILFLAAVVRFYRLADMANFDFDQEYASNFAYSIIHDHLKLLIGQELSVQGLFMGPWYFYYLVPFFALTQLHPIGGFIGSVVLGLINVGISYFVAKNIFGQKAALIAAFFRAFLFNNISNDWTMVPTYSSDGVILLSWWCFYLYWRGNTKVLPFLTLLFGLFTSIHPILFPLYFIFLILVLIKRQFPKIQILTLSLITFLLPILPLLLFEYWHQFWEVRKLFSVFAGNGSTAETKSWMRLFSYLQTIVNQPYAMVNVHIIPQVVFNLILLGLVVWCIYKKLGFWKDSFHSIMLVSAYLVVIVYYTFFPTHVPEYYFKILETISLFYITGLFGIFMNKKITTVIVVIFLLVVIQSNFQQLLIRWNNPNLVTLSHKDDVVKQILTSQPKDKKFYVSFINSLGWNSGFNYLFKVYNRPPTGTAANSPVYTIVIPKNLANDSINYFSGNVGLIWPDKSTQK